LRENYSKGELDESHCNPDPFQHFQTWFAEAKDSKLKEPNAMTLATATPGGRPSARIVLLKEVTNGGFVFYSNYLSHKGKELSDNPQAALIFYWAELERQVRIEGAVETVTRQETETYFRRRPKGSRLGALISQQSRVIANKQLLQEQLVHLEDTYKDTDDVPVPETWGGYRVLPEIFEFWQGRPNRLHDRIQYRREPGSAHAWTIERLSP
jgi:pyridoxamine 5'-phosphate oxidase